MPNHLNIKSLKLLNELESGKYYDFYYDNQITPNKKFDAKKTYKKNTGYFPGVVTIDGKIVYVENRDGNANVKFKLKDTTATTIGIANEEFTVQLLNAYNKPVYQKRFRTKRFTINASRYRTGIYYFRIIKGNKVYSKKVIITK